MSQEKQGKARVRRPERSQVQMRLECDDDLVPAEHPVRLIWQVTGNLDLSAFYAAIQAREGHVGRDATDPRLLVALWLYAATRGVGSARELDRLCRESRPYQWLCGGVSVNYHLLADFRVGHQAALDQLFTEVIAVLVSKGLVKLKRLSQDGMRVRANVGAGSYRREQSLQKLLEEAREHVQQLNRQLQDPAYSAGLSAQKQAARKRAAQERQQRLERALKLLPQLQQKRQQQAKKNRSQVKDKPLRVSTTEADTPVMKMPDGGFRPAVNVQVGSDCDNRLILGVDVSLEGTDNVGQGPAMRQQVQQRTGQQVQEHLVDGGYLKLDHVQEAQEQGVTLYVPPKPPRNKDLRGSEYEPRATDSPAIQAWRERMGSEQGQQVYRQRAATSETINADLRCFRGLAKLTVRGLQKIKCVVLWSALAYNLLHVAQVLLEA